jgi:LmbE family N-acetylglucosaminyl deacetylase
MRGRRLDISAHLPAKRRAIAAHASQYGGIITDDPAGFQLPSDLLREFDSPWETFLLS